MSVKTESKINLKASMEFHDEYSSLFNRYFTTLMRMKNIAPFYAMEDNFKKIIIQYLQRKKDSIIFGEFSKNKLMSCLSNFMISFYIYNDNEKEFMLEDINHYLEINNLDFIIIFDFSIKNLKSDIRIRFNDNIIVINCATAYEDYFLKNKTSEQFLVHVDEYLRALACHYYQYINICSPASKPKDQRIEFKNRFSVYLDRIFDNAKINNNRSKYTDGISDVIKVKLIDTYISILFNAISMELLKDPHHKRLAMLPLDRLGYAGGIKLLINSCQDVKKYMKYYTSEEISVITEGYFYQIRVKEVPTDIYAKVIK